MLAQEVKGEFSVIVRASGGIFNPCCLYKLVEPAFQSPYNAPA